MRIRKSPVGILVVLFSLALSLGSLGCDHAVTLKAIALDPATATVSNGETQQLHAIGTFSDGSSQDVSDDVTWTSSDNSVAGVNGAGYVSAFKVGTAKITATGDDGIKAVAVITVSDARLTKVEVSPVMATVPAGRTQQFTATGIYSDHTTRPLTDRVKWSSSNPSDGVVSNEAGRNGLATGVSPGGPVTITATDERTGLKGAAQLTVTNAVLASLAVSINDVATSFPAGTQHQLTATATYSDGSAADVTAQVTWSSGAEALATVSSGGLVTGQAAGGPVTITARDAMTGQTATIAVTVTDAELVTMTLSPDVATAPVGRTQRFTATGTYSDGSTRPISARALIWENSGPSVATLGTGVDANLATAIQVGSAQIKATDAATEVSATAKLAVTAAVLESIEISPANIEVEVGKSAQAHARGTFSDASVRDITSAVTWSTDSPGIVFVSNAQAERGRVTGVAGGETQLRAIDPATLVAGAAPVKAIAYKEYVATADLTGSVTLISTLAGGALDTASSFAASASYSIVAHPSGKFLFVAGYFANSITVHGLNAATGAIDASTSYPVAGAPIDLALDAYGKVLYSANNSAATVSALRVNATTGQLTSLGSVPTDSDPVALALSPTGKFLFVVNNSGGSIRSFSIDPATGALSAAGVLSTGLNSVGATVDPSGAFLYVANGSHDSVSAYAINSTTGALTPIATYPNAGFPYGLATDANGGYLYVSNLLANSVSRFAINAVTGELASLGAPLGVSAVQPIDFARSSDGATLYLAGRDTGDVLAFAMNPLTGALTQLGSAVTAGGSSNGIATIRVRQP